MVEKPVHAFRCALCIADGQGSQSLATWNRMEEGGTKQRRRCVFCTFAWGGLHQGRLKNTVSSRIQEGRHGTACKVRASRIQEGRDGTVRLAKSGVESATCEVKCYMWRITYTSVVCSGFSINSWKEK